MFILQHSSVFLLWIVLDRHAETYISFSDGRGGGGGARNRACSFPLLVVYRKAAHLLHDLLLVSVHSHCLVSIMCCGYSYNRF